MKLPWVSRKRYEAEAKSAELAERRLFSSQSDVGSLLLSLRQARRDADYLLGVMPSPPIRVIANTHYEPLRAVVSVAVVPVRQSMRYMVKLLDYGEYGEELIESLKDRLAMTTVDRWAEEMLAEVRKALGLTERNQDG